MKFDRMLSREAQAIVLYHIRTEIGFGAIEIAADWYDGVDIRLIRCLVMASQAYWLLQEAAKEVNLVDDYFEL
jgi:hypothetical protein